MFEPQCLVFLPPPLLALAGLDGDAPRRTRRRAPIPSVGTGSSPAGRRPWPGKGRGVHGGSGPRPAAPLGGAGRSSQASVSSRLLTPAVDLARCLSVCHAGSRRAGPRANRLVSGGGARRFRCPTVAV